MIGSRVSGDPLPAAHVKLLKVLRLRANSQLTAIVLSEFITGRETHWVDGRTRKCFRQTEACNHCVLQRPRKWRGYLHVVTGPGGYGGILELTPDLARTIIDAWPSRPNLRGLRLEIRRGASNNSRLTLVNSDDSHSFSGELLAAEDPNPTLDFLFAS
jgi:hypothetical protein